MFKGHFAPMKLTFEYYSPFTHQMQDIFTLARKDFSSSPGFRNGVLIRKTHGAKTTKNTGCSFMQPVRKNSFKPLHDAHFRDIIRGVTRQKSSP